MLNNDKKLLNRKLESQVELDDLVKELIKIMEEFQEKDALSFNVSTI